MGTPIIAALSAVISSFCFLNFNYFANYLFKIFFIFYFLFLKAPRGIQDSGSLMRDQISVPCAGNSVLTTGLPKKSLM